ncbi:hypothetical protein [Streptomyces sp. bgisy154]|uniref:hypothetical protein n=1 Tax=Streptomyces sp. bgisy154 TaxID=3413794 RepID=UPI003D70D69B
MTYPPAQPPQDGQGPGDGYGAGPYGPPPQRPDGAGHQPNPYGTPPVGGQPTAPIPGPYGTPPGPGAQPPYGTTPPPGGQPPYGQTPYPQAPYGPPGYPPAPPGGGSGKRRTALIVGAAVTAVVLVVGGVFLATRGDDGDGGTAKGAESTSAAPTVSDGPTGEPTGEPTEEPSDDPLDEPTEEPTEEPADDPGPAPATGFVGQWREPGGALLTVGQQYTSGEYKGKYPLNILGGEEGILMGMGADAGGGTFRIAVAPYGSTDKSELRAGTCTRVGDSVKIAWDKGGTDTLEWTG